MKINVDWPEVRHRRKMMLAQTDWSQLNDVPEHHSQAFGEIRTRLRDVTDRKSPLDAWIELDNIQVAMDGV